MDFKYYGRVGGMDFYHSRKYCKIDHAQPRIVRPKVCLFVTEEIPITVSRPVPDKEAWPNS